MVNPEEHGYTTASMKPHVKERLKDFKNEHDLSYTEAIETLLDAHANAIDDSKQDHNSSPTNTPTLEEVQELVKDARVVHSRVLTKYDGEPTELNEPLETLTETLNKLAETVDA